MEDAGENMNYLFCIFLCSFAFLSASQVVLMTKNPPARAGDIRDAGSIPGLGRSPGGGHDNHSSILAWRIPWTEEPDRLWFIRS